MSADRLVNVVLVVVLLMFSAIVHECSHGWMALRLGDPTAKEQGRLTLNPLAHIDPVGSIVLPLLMALVGGPIFAYAKPVPFNPRRLRHPERDEALVALAGPVSNLLQALAGDAVLFVAWQLFVAFPSWSATAWYWVSLVLSTYIYVNLSLAFFNLIPVPPLDGSKLLSLVVRGRGRRVYDWLQHYGMAILLVCLYVLPYLGIDPIGWLLDVTVGNSYSFLLSWAG